MGGGRGGPLIEGGGRAARRKKKKAAMDVPLLQEHSFKPTATARRTLRSRMG